MKHLQQSLNTDDDSFTYTVSGETEPRYRVVLQPGTGTGEPWAVVQPGI